MESINTGNSPIPTKPVAQSLSVRSSEPVARSLSLRSSKEVARSMSVRSSKPPIPLPPPVATDSHVVVPPHQFLYGLSNRAEWQEECEQKVYEEIQIREGPAVLFAELAERQSHKLPVVVELSCSFYGLCEDLTLTTEDKISLHFLKKTECVRIGGKDGKVLAVPIDSLLRFSPLYEGMEEYNILNFQSVKKLVFARPHPLVVSVTKMRDPENSKATPAVAIGDVLVLKESKRKNFREGHVQCFNTRSNQEFRLNEDCGMHFTMKSEWTKLSLSLLLEHVKLPQRCSVHAEDNAQGAELQLLCWVFHDRICTLLSSSLETSFIASVDDERVFEIATDFDVPVHMIKMSGSSRHNLVDRTSDLFRSFHPRMVTAVISSNTKYELDMLALTKCVSDSDAMVGISLIQPESIEQKPTASGHQYDYVHYDHVKEGLKKASLDLYHEDMKLLQKKKVNYRLQDPEKKSTPLKHDKEQMQLHTNQCYGIVSKTAGSVSASQEDNKCFLRTLTCKQVLQLLDCMELGIYKPFFHHEDITGDLLLELDEIILEEELGIESQIHRIRVMMLITGQYSAKEILARSTIHSHSHC